jgi:hypothetical protein
MKVRSSIPKSVLAALAALTVAAPVAGAVPLYDGHPPHRATGEAYDVNRETGAYTPTASTDMHASTVTPPAFEEEVVATDLRTEAAKAPLESRAGTDSVPGTDLRTEASKSPLESPAGTDSVPGTDLRTEASKSPLESPAGTDSVPGTDLRTEAAKEPELPPGLPVFPSPLELPAPATSAQPVAASGGDDGSFDWPLAGLIAGGAIALLGAALIAGRQVRGHARPAH